MSSLPARYRDDPDGRDEEPVPVEQNRTDYFDFNVSLMDCGCWSAPVAFETAFP